MSMPSRPPSSLERDPPEDLSQSVELVGAAKKGDEAALNELFKRYESRIHRIARIRMGARVRSFMDSVDLVQNTYIVAMRRIQDLELRSHASIIQWLSRILENQIHDAADYANAGKRNRDLEVPIAEANATDSTPGVRPEAREPQPLQRLAQNEIRAIFDSCVQELDEAQREVVLLRDYSGGSWDYIARELGRPNAHAAQELHRRARIKLAQLVSRRIDFDA